MTRFFIRQPLLVNLLMLGVLGGGAYLYKLNVKEHLPTIAAPAAWIAVQDIGTPVQDMEDLVTTPLEAALNGVVGVDKTRSKTSEGRVLIRINFDPALDDFDKALADAQAAVQRVRLPRHLPMPRVEQIQVATPALTIVLYGAEETAEERWALGEVAKVLQRKLRALTDVGDIKVSGSHKHELQIRLDPKRLRAQRLTLREVTHALAQRRSTMPGGSYTRGGEEVAVRTLNRLKSLEELRQVVVRRQPGSEPIRLGDLGQVKRGVAKAQRLASVGGESAIVFSVGKKAGGDVLRLDHQVRDVLQRMRPSLPKPMAMEILGSAAPQVERGLSTLFSNGLIGFALVLCVLWLFIGARSALIAACGIPVAVLGSFVAMKLMGISVSSLSLFALILCLGLVVDDAIVIVENIYRHMRQGLAPTQAAIVGTREVMWPVISSTLTTLAAFLPLLLMTGVIGQFFSIIPKVVAAALLVSLLEALIILPSHMADFARLPPQTRQQRGRFRLERWLRVYERVLRAVLRRPTVVVTLALLLVLGLGAAALATKDVVLFAEDDIERIDVRVRMPHGTALDKTMAFLQRVEAQSRGLLTESALGMVTQAGWMRTESWTEDGKHLGMVEVFLRKRSDRSRAGRELIQALERSFRGLAGAVSIEVKPMTFTPPVGKPVAVRVISDDLQRLHRLTRQIQGEMAQVRGVVGVDHDLHHGKKEISLRLDETRAAALGVSREDFSQQVRASFSQLDLGDIYLGARTLPLSLSIALTPAAEQLGPEALHAILGDGRQVPLTELARVEQGWAAPIVSHRDGRRCVTISASLSSGQTAAGASRLLSARLAPLREANPDVEFTIGGEWEATSRSLESLMGAFFVAALLIYIVLSTQFRSVWQPVVVLLSVPLSLIGVLLGFFVSGQPVGLIALVGVVGLAGIAVNDATLLVDFVNVRRRDGMEVVEALVAACRLRLRPVLLTTVTTVAGLLPLSMGWGGTAKTLEPMALVMVWGLSFCTALTLLVVPTCYLSLHNAQLWLFRSSAKVHSEIPDLELPLEQRLTQEVSRPSA
ncbi:MAG: efflux RND transporter permease subunit [Deltaproteobacteria bacterium]|nr:efflux RND transporter permease subunit [Deltaproteobacteria bacterium]